MPADVASRVSDLLVAARGAIATDVEAARGIVAQAVPTRNSVWSSISTVRRMIRTPRVPSIHCSSRLILTSARTSFLLVFK